MGVVGHDRSKRYASRRVLSAPESRRCRARHSGIFVHQPKRPSLCKCDRLRSFGGEGSARYFQVTVEAMSRNQAVLDILKNNEPAVRNDLVLLYSSQDSATLLSTDGKEKLRAATLAAMRKVLDEEGADGKLIEQVYFTSFVIQ